MTSQTLEPPRPSMTLLHNPPHKTKPDTKPEPESKLESEPESLTLEPEPQNLEQMLHNPKSMNTLTMNPVPAPAKPVWNPKDKNAPLKEDYVQFYQDTLQYHYLTTGFLTHGPELHTRIPVLLNQLESFTDKVVILVSVADLCVHVEKLTTMHVEGVAESAA
jgi:hypothetical protein